MSQRSALLRLQQHLLLRRISASSDPEALAERLRVANLMETHDDAAFTDEVMGALDELAGPPPEEPDVPSGDRAIPVTPLEKLQALFALSASTPDRLGGLPDNERNAVDDLASWLLEPESQSSREAGASMRQIIDVMDTANGFLRVDGFNEKLDVARAEAGPTPPPTASDDLETIGDVVDRLAAEKGLTRPPIDPTLAAHPVVHVKARLYRALVRGRAEVPVHLRTTIRFAGERVEDVKRFDRILQPAQWPEYNAFWQRMENVAVDAPAPKGQAAPKVPAKIRAAERVLRTTTRELKPDWKLAGLFLEQVGFAKGADLYPNTFLFFVDRNAAGREVLSYSLVDRSECALGVDDGCIEVAFRDGRIDVSTTKSLYIDGEGNDAEASGILAYMAVYLGWGAQTLLLVMNAVHS